VIGATHLSGPIRHAALFIPESLPHAGATADTMQGATDSRADRSLWSDLSVPLERHRIWSKPYHSEMLVSLWDVIAGLRIGLHIHIVSKALLYK
jgi:hypothetical protein